MNVYRRGEKIYLRPLEPADAPTVAPWFNDEEIRRTLSQYRPLSVEDEAERIAKVNASGDALLGILNRVELRVNDDHPAALRAYEKVGFRDEWRRD